MEYFFIYSNAEEMPIGLNRASQLDFNSKTCKSSSWISIKGLKYEPLKMLVIGNEIVFNLLDIEMSWGEVHKMNSKAIRVFNLFGYKFKDIGKEYYNFLLIKNDFFRACDNDIMNRIIAQKK